MIEADLAAIRERVTQPHGEHSMLDVMRLLAWAEQLQKELRAERQLREQAEFLLQ
jgi:hypothetical protein